MLQKRKEHEKATIPVPTSIINLLCNPAVQPCAQWQVLSQLQNSGHEWRNSVRFLAMCLLAILKETDKPQLPFPVFTVPSSGCQEKLFCALKKTKNKKKLAFTKRRTLKSLVPKLFSSAWWLSVCVTLVRLQYPDIWSNTHLDFTGHGLNETKLQSIDFASSRLPSVMGG